MTTDDQGMGMLRVLAVDDEGPALDELLYLLRADPRVASAEGAVDATSALRLIGRGFDSSPDGAEAIDVVFLDISMPGLTGLDMTRLLAGFAEPPLVVFVTAHEGFAVQAFDLKAVDYILKPVRRDRLSQAVRRVAEQVEAARQARRAEPEPTPSPAAASGGGDRRVSGPVSGPVSAADRTTPDHIPVELGGVTRFVPVDEISHVEAQGDYARLHTASGSYLVRVPLSTLEERWRDRDFVRIHRRYLVALKSVAELRLDAGSTSVRVGDEFLAVSRRHARELRELLMRQSKG